MKKVKGWLRYWCCDRSGSGVEKWTYLYRPNWKNYRLEDIWEEIQHSYEDWSRWAESYSYDIEWTDNPPIEEVEKLIVSKAAQMETLEDHIKTLKKQIKLLQSVDTQDE